MKDEKLQRIPITFEDAGLIDDRFTKVIIYLMHTGLNKNLSVFEKSVVEKAFPSLSNTPILGYIQIDENNEKDFEGHKNIIVIEDGDYKLKYAGQAYGVIGESCNPRWEMRNCDDGIDREFLVVDGILWSSKFVDVKEIFDRDSVKQQSMELADSYSGFMNELGAFCFSSFNFYGACVLGDSKMPAMINSTIEKVFSFDEYKEEIQSQMELLKFTLNQKQQLTQLELDQKNQPLSLTPNNVDNIDSTNINSQINLQTNQSNFTEEGGTNILEEKLAFITKYSNLTEEDIKDLKSDIDKYSLEEFDTQLKEISEKKDQNQNNFEMTNEQLKTAIRQSLSEQKVIKHDYWGDAYESQLYYYQDIVGNVVIVIDNEWENYFGISYTINGDTVTLDYVNKVAYLPDWRVKESADVSNQFSLNALITEQIKFNVEKATQKAKESFSVIDSQEYIDLQSKFSVLEVEKQTWENEKTELNSKFSILETEKQTLETEKADFEAKCTAFEVENEALKTFKDNTLTTQRKKSEDILFEMFSQKLSDEEMKPVKDIAMNFSLEEIEDKLYILVAKKTTKFEHKITKPKVDFTFEKPEQDSEIKTGRVYDDIVNQYVNK